MQKDSVCSAQDRQERLEQRVKGHEHIKEQQQEKSEVSSNGPDSAGGSGISTVDDPSQSLQISGKRSSDGTFTLLLFASAQTYADDTESLTLPAPMTLAELFQELERRYPGIGQKVLRSCGVSVNLEYVDLEWDEIMAEGKQEDGRNAEAGRVTIRKGDEVGIIPPVSSG